jgi:hypothetical protein
MGGGYICNKKKTQIVEQIREIVFKKAGNPFLDSGIIGLYRMSHRFLRREKGQFPSVAVSGLEGNQLSISADGEEELMKYLEEVYYFMGNEYYDTVTQKQEEEQLNVYFEERDEGLVPHHFPRISTYGLTHLFTNNAQGTTRIESNSCKLVALKEERPDYAEFIESYFKEKKIKLGKKVYLNGPYTKLTRLKLDKKYLLKGPQICPLTGECFKALVEAKNVSPFLSGLSNFNTFLSSSEKQISWKALYLIRFAPAVCFYSYHNKYESLICHLFTSDKLENLDVFYDRAMYVTKDELKRTGYSVNIQLNSFSYPRKDQEALVIDTAKDAVWPSELSFMLIYTFYNQHLKTRLGDASVLDFFEDAPILNRPITLVTFKADKFASTMRPNSYEEYNQIKFVLRLLYLLETGIEGKSIPISELWRGLRFNSPKAQIVKKQDFQKGKALERKIRAEVLESIMNARSILPTIESLYYDAFNSLVNQESAGYRNYKVLFDFLTLYEKIVNMELDQDLQEYAINLGTSIGQGILRFDGSGEDEYSRAKGGRKYIIDLRNSRTLDQFLQAIERIMFKYQIGVKKDLMSRITNRNFMLVKRFAVISALNQLNPILSKQNKN